MPRGQGEFTRGISPFAVIVQNLSNAGLAMAHHFFYSTVDKCASNGQIQHRACVSSRVIVLAHHEIGMLGDKIAVRYKTITDLYIGLGSRSLKGFCAGGTCAEGLSDFWGLELPPKCSEIGAPGRQ
jgi:hypothetical protein